jgi:hypothetical protein
MQTLTFAGTLVFAAILFNFGRRGHRLAHFAHQFPADRPRHFGFSSRQFLALELHRDEAHLHSRGRATSGSARKESIGVASSTRSDIDDRISNYSRLQKLLADNTAKIQIVLAGAAWMATGSRARHLRGETIAQLGVNLKTTASNRRTQSHTNPIPLCAQTCHSVHALTRNPGERPTPSGVESADNSGLGITQEHRHTIGGKDSEGDSWHISHHSIADSARALVLSSNCVDELAMNLLQTSDEKIRERGMPARPVTAHCVRIVAQAFTQIKRGVRSPAYASVTSQESMHKIRKIPGAEHRKHGRVA